MDGSTKINGIKEFSVRTKNCLSVGGFKTLDELIDIPGPALMGLPNFGIRSFREVQKVMENVFGKWPPKYFGSRASRDWKITWYVSPKVYLDSWNIWKDN